MTRDATHFAQNTGSDVTGEPFQFPSVLYHGTRTSLLPGIRAHGLQPRRESGRSNWDHTVQSRDDAVYLTSAYGLYYATCCQADGAPCILEIETARLEGLCFAADEDGVAQLKSARKGLPHRWELKELTEYWRSRAHTIQPEVSLLSIGNCTYLGAIPPEAIRRVLVLEPGEAFRLTMEACDPVISVLNFKLFGEEFQRFQRWLFDPVDTYSTLVGDVRPPKQTPVAF